MFGANSLLQNTAARLDRISGVGKPLFVCNEEHRFLVAEQIRKIGKECEAIVLEPEGRNTAPALTIAALYLVGKDPDAMMVVMPADHVIPDEDAFTSAVERGAGLAENGYLVTFGVESDKPETGYGYICRGEELEGSGVFLVDRFVEKPDLETAQEYVRSGDYYWNSGIFLMRAERWLDEIGKFRPAILEACPRWQQAGQRFSTRRQEGIPVQPFGVHRLCGNGEH
jgi:mannose-1-phosphate guanylyltransferase/mannose-6-phosphate isomerase